MLCVKALVDASAGGGLSFVYPYGASLSVQRPAQV